MPTRIYDFRLKKAIDRLKERLETINRADGYNTTPTVQIGAGTLESVPEGEFPKLCIEMGDLTPESEQMGSTPIIRWIWPAFVWGYVFSDSDHGADLYDAGLGLLVDTFAAVYSDEGLTDGAGAGTVHMMSPGEVTFDMESFAHENRGYFLAEFQILVDMQRSNTP